MYKHNRSAKLKAYEASLRNAINGTIIPVLAYAKITRDCNLSCSYCVEHRMLVNTDMGLENWKRVADTAYMLGNRSISLVGGEPLLASYVLDLVDYISDRDTFVSTSTNGHFIDEDFLDALDGAGLDSLNFSIDTLGDRTQPTFGKDLTPKLEQTLKRIATSSYRFKTSIAAVVTKYNLPILPEMLHFFSDLGMPVSFKLMVRGVINQSYTENLALGEDNLSDVERMVEKLLSMKSEGFLLGNNDFTRLTPQMGVRTPAGVYQMYMGGSSSHSCNGGAYDLPVDNDGRLGSCCTGLTSSTHIFELNSIEDYHAYIDRNRVITDQCKGCPWPHKWVLSHLEETGGFMKG